MKSKIVIDKEDKKEEFNVLFRVETDDKNHNYVVYTKEEQNDDGDTIAYAANYMKVNGKQILEPIEDEDILEFLDSILLQVQSKMNKEVGD